MAEVMEKEELVAVKSSTREIDKYTGVYVLRPAKKSYLSQLNPNHDGAILFSDAKVYLCPDLTTSGGVRTGLTDQEARELEEELGFPKMSLSPYNRDFWANFKLYPYVGQKGVELNLASSAMDKLKYLFCKVSSRVATSWAEALDNPMKEFVLVSQETEAKNETSQLMVKMEAMNRLKLMTFDTQMEFLKVYDAGKFKVSKGSSPDFVFSTIGKIVDEHPAAFLQTLENPNYKNMAFLQDCILAGIIKKSGAKYFVVGGDMLGNTYLDAIENLGKSEYSELKVALKAKIDSIK